MRFAVIPTYNRPAELQRCIDSIAPQVDWIIIVNNGDRDAFAANFVLPDPDTDVEIEILERPGQPPNLSYLWNEGICEARALAGKESAWVAVLNDDATVPAMWMDMLIAAMQATGAAAGSSMPHGKVFGELYRNYTTPISSVWERMCGWAFLLAPHSNIADEDLQWWFGDTALDEMARRNGGTVLMNIDGVTNAYAGQSTTGVLAEQAGRDRETFENSYGPLTWWPGA